MCAKTDVFSFKNKKVIITTIFVFSINALIFANQLVTSDSGPNNAFVFIILSFSVAFLFVLFLINFKANNDLKKIINTDEITGFPKKDVFVKEVSKLLKKASKNEYTLLSIDIENFRYITASIDIETSNSVLKCFAEHFKKVAPEQSLACRNYMDNFYILLKGYGEALIEEYTIMICDLDKEMSHILPKHYKINFSVGAYTISEPSIPVEHMLVKVNTARSLGKRSFIPERVSFYSEKMDIDTENEREISFDMNRAFEEHEFEVYYQPKYRLSDDMPTGAEALIRWNHNKKGLLHPSAFVPLFEKNGFIKNIDKLVFTTVCKFLDKWNKSFENEEEIIPLTLSCNLSRAVLYDKNVAAEYKKIASEYKISPCKIEIELTESLMMDNKDRLLKAMNEIHNAGFNISVDDFGSGFSSLSLLKDIPANVIKLDKEFLNTDRTNLKEKIIVNSVINMAKELNITTVAEGVEEKAQLDQLKEMGCDIVQGFYYAKPMPEAEYYNLLNKKLG